MDWFESDEDEIEMDPLLEQDSWAYETEACTKARDAEEAIDALFKSHMPTFGKHFCLYEGRVHVLLQLSSGPRTYAEGSTSSLVILQQISVKPSERRKGLATATIHALAEAAEAHNTRLMIQSVISTEMRAALEKMNATKIPYDDDSYYYTPTMQTCARPMRWYAG